MEQVSPEAIKEYARQTVLVLDLIGTFVFALSGAAAGVRKRLDVFGVFVVAFAAGNLGGVIRDLLIGSIPPAAIQDWRYAAVSLPAAVIAFRWYPTLDRLHGPIRVFDAAGLALFAVAGTQKALDYGMNPFTAPLLGMLTGIGGGIVRDILVGQVPWVLRSEFYAVAALTGSAVVVAGHLLGFPAAVTAIAGAAICFGMRFLAIRQGWDLPVAGPQVDQKAQNPPQPDPSIADDK